MLIRRLKNGLLDSKNDEVNNLTWRLFDGIFKDVPQLSEFARATKASQRVQKCPCRNPFGESTLRRAHPIERAWNKMPGAVCRGVWLHRFQDQTTSESVLLLKVEAFEEISHRSTRSRILIRDGHWLTNDLLQQTALGPLLAGDLSSLTKTGRWKIQALGPHRHYSTLGHRYDAEKKRQQVERWHWLAETYCTYSVQI